MSNPNKDNFQPTLEEDFDYVMPETRYVKRKRKDGFRIEEERVLQQLHIIYPAGENSTPREEWRDVPTVEIEEVTDEKKDAD